MNKKQAKWLAYYILQLLLTINVALFVLILILNTTLFSNKYMNKKMEQTNYYELLYNDMREQMEETLPPTGFDETILKDTFTKEDVRKTTIKVIHNFYNNTEIKVDSTAFREKLVENIETDLKNKKYKVEDQTELDNMIDDLTDYYENSLDYHGFLEKFRSPFKKILDIVRILLVISILSIIMIIVLLYITNRQRDKISIMFITNGFIFVSLAIYINSNMNVDNLFLYSEGLSSLLKVLFNNMITMLSITCIVSLLLGIAHRIYYLYRATHHKRKKKNKKENDEYEEDLS